MYEINPENIIKAQKGNKEILEEIIKTALKYLAR